MTDKELSEAVAHACYKALVRADDDIELEVLNDADLKAYRNLCQNGLIDAGEEIRRRGL